MCCCTATRVRAVCKAKGERKRFPYCFALSPLPPRGTTHFLQPGPAIFIHCNMALIVYSSLWCPDCRTAKRFLDKHNISYTDIDIEATPGAADEVIRHAGKRAVPQFVIDGRWVQPYRPGEGFLYEEISKLLGIMDEG